MSKGLDYTALTLVIIGAVNWGLIGIFKLDLVNLIFGNMTWMSRVIYTRNGLRVGKCLNNREWTAARLKEDRPAAVWQGPVENSIMYFISPQLHTVLNLRRSHFHRLRC